VECYATKHKDNGYTGKLKVKYWRVLKS
jgi:hypothetical protein